jgi:hypothetical protein
MEMLSGVTSGRTTQIISYLVIETVLLKQGHCVVQNTSNAILKFKDKNLHPMFF